MLLITDDSPEDRVYKRLNVAEIMYSEIEEVCNNMTWDRVIQVTSMDLKYFQPFQAAIFHNFEYYSVWFVGTGAR